MSFRLLIECSKDLDELHINFSDGTVITKESKSDVYKEKQDTSIKNNCLDTEVEFGSVQQEIVPLPVIPEKQRGVKVAEEMQKLSF